METVFHRGVECLIVGGFFPTAKILNALIKYSRRCVMIENGQSQYAEARRTRLSDNRQCSFDPQKLHTALEDTLFQLVATMWMVFDLMYYNEMSKKEAELDAGRAIVVEKTKNSVEWLDLWNARLAAADWIEAGIARQFFDGSMIALRILSATDIAKIRNQCEIQDHLVGELVTRALNNPTFMWGVCSYCQYMEGKTARSISGSEREDIVTQLPLMLYAALASEHVLGIIAAHESKEQHSAELVAFLRLFAQQPCASEHEGEVVSKEDCSRLLVFQTLSEEGQAAALQFANTLQGELRKGFKVSSLSYLLRKNELQSAAPKDAVQVHQQAYELFLNLLISLQEPRHPTAIRGLAVGLPKNEICEDLHRFLAGTAEKAAVLWDYRIAKAQEAAELEEQLRQKQEEAQKLRAAEKAASDLQRLNEFQSKTQIVPLPIDTSEFLEKLSSTAVVSQLESAKQLCLALIETHEFFDYRGVAVSQLGDPMVRELVDICYSKETLTRLARACGINQTKYLKEYGNPSDTTLEELTHRLSALYHKSSYMREQLDLLIKDPTACLLIGSVCLSLREVEEYAGSTLRRRTQGTAQVEQREQFSGRIVSRLQNTHNRRKRKDLLIKYRQDSSGVSQNATAVDHPSWFRQLEHEVSSVMLYWDAVRGGCSVVPIEEPQASFFLPAQKFKDLENAIVDVVRLKERALIEFKMRDAAEQLQQRGFQISRRPDGEISRIEHTAAAISIPVNPSKQEWFKLENAIALHDQYRQKLETVQEALSGVGIEVVSHGDKWSLVNAQRQEIFRGDGSDIPEEKFGQIRALIAAVRAEQAIAEQQRQVELQQKQRVENRRQVEAQEVIPHDGVPILVLDASVLFALLAPVTPQNEGTTFLHVLKAAFGKFGRLYIPAKALFEVRGNVYHLDTSGTVQTIEIILHDNTDAKNTDSIVKQSAHLGFTGEEETPYAIKGQGHTAIVHVPADTEFFFRAQAHRDATVGKSIAMREKFQRQHAGGQLGDYAINDILSLIKEDCPVIVATVDGTFVRHEMMIRTLGGVQTKVISWQEIVRYLCTYEYNAFRQVGIQDIPTEDQAIDSILDYLTSRELGAGAALKTRGDVVINADQFEMILRGDDGLDSASAGYND